MPDISFQPNKIFVRNGLFEKIIESCKATNLEFLKLKEKLGLCIYEEICDEKEFILMSERSFIQHDVENKKLKEENKSGNKNENKNDNKNENQNEQFKKNKKLKVEIESLNWFDKLQLLLTVTNLVNKMGEFKYIDMTDLVNNIRNNRISKKTFEYIRKIKNGEIKDKRLIPGQKELLIFN